MIFLFEWRSALGMRRVALASAESNAAPSVAKPVAARPAGKRPNKSKPYIGLFNQNGTLPNAIFYTILASSIRLKVSNSLITALFSGIKDNGKNAQANKPRRGEMMPCFVE